MEENQVQLEKELKEAINLLKQSSAFIDVIRFEEGEEVDKYNLESKINNFLKKYES